MNTNKTEQLLTDTIDQALAIYCEARHRSDGEKAAASRELRAYLPVLIQLDTIDPERLTEKALRHLRELEYRPSSVAVN
jgi:hypothetical protein